MIIPEFFLSYACGIIANTDFGLSTSKILSLCSNYAIKYNVQIPHTKQPIDAPNKRTALFDNLVCFSPEQQFYIIKELCSTPELNTREDIAVLERQLRTRYGKLDADNCGYDKALVIETSHWLSCCPDALHLYKASIEKRDSGIYERNLLDDLRLSLELLLKRVLNNNKSLENQISGISALIQQAGGSREFCNMFNKLLDYFCKYQNEHVKHNDLIPEMEIDFIVDITSAFMRTIAKYCS